MSDAGGRTKSGGYKLQEETLTVRDHLDPDKHWIGETLPVPTQTEIAATIGTISGPGDSPIPARADHLHKLEGGITTFDIALATGWENYPGYSQARTLRYGHVVLCQGLIRRATGAAVFTSGTVGTVPVGCRPVATDVYIALAHTTAAAFVRLDVSSGGTITLSSAPAVSFSPGYWLTLANLKWSCI